MALNNAAHRKYVGTMASQESQRDHAVWFDQHRSSTFRDANGEAIFEHGRPYWSVIEKRSRMPSGPVMPLGWEAPVIAPQAYIIKSIGRITNLRVVGGEGLKKSTVTDRFAIDYAQWERDDTQALNDHWKLAVATASEKDWDVPRLGQPMDRRLLAIVGPMPRSPKIARACAAGDPWALGMLMPSLDPKTGQMRVEENVELARLLKMGRNDLLTVEEAEREELEREQMERARRMQNDPEQLSEAMAILAEAKRMMKEIEAERAALKRERPKGGRPVGSTNKPKPVEAGV